MPLDRFATQIEKAKKKEDTDEKDRLNVRPTLSTQNKSVFNDL